MVLSLTLNSVKLIQKTWPTLSNQTIKQIISSKYSTTSIKTKEAVETQIALKENEVRVQVQFYCVDTTSYLNLKKEKSEESSVSLVPDCELSGEVIEVGSNVKPDTAVVGENIAALNFNKKSGFIDECVIDAQDVYRLPANVPPSKAALIVFGHSTALYAFSRLCKPPPKEGTSLLISCGAAGLGLAALDIAAGIYKSKVIGVSDTEERAELMRKRGAFAAVSLNEKKLQQRILKRNNNKEMDIVYDGLGEENLRNMMSCAKLGGTIISANTPEDKIIKPPTNVFFSIVNLEHLRSKDSDLYRQVVLDTLELADQGVLSPHICAQYSLEKINEALKFIDENKTCGKILIQMND